MGTGYKGNTHQYHKISENLPVLISKYLYRNGYFGHRGKSNSSRVRILSVDDPQIAAKDFYDNLAHGGLEEAIFNKKTGEEIGKQTHMADGSIITWRNVSSSDGSPCIQINIISRLDSGGIKYQKIHFVKEK